MRAGRLTQTVWNRTVRRQLHIKNASSNYPIWNPSPWQECAAVRLDENGVEILRAGQEQKNIAPVRAEQDHKDVAMSHAGSDPEGTDMFWAEASAQGTGGWIGYYAVLQAAGNLAAAGVMPSGLSVTCYLPEDAEEELCGEIASSVHESCGQMGIRVNAFRGEIISALGQPMLHATAVGSECCAGSCDSLRGCAPGEEILFCGYAGLEGMLRLLEEAGEEPRERFSSSFLAQAEACKRDLVLPGQILEVIRSCTKDGVPCVTAARQVTEGGILAQLWNFAEEQEIGFDIGMKNITLRQETVELCEFYGLNPYQMTSAGSYLLAVTDADLVIRALEQVGARAGRLGVVRAQKARTITSGEETRYLDRPAQDELIAWRRGRCG